MQSVIPDLNTVSLILPEIVISIVLLAIVLLDLIFHKDKTIIPIAAITGIIIVFMSLFRVAGSEGTAFSIGSTPHGMFTLDGIAVFFKFLIVVTTALIFVFNISSDEIEKIKNRSGEYYALLFGMLLGMSVLVSASDLILIYLSLELLSLSSYVLAGFTKLRERNSEASLKYIIYGSVSSALMLFGISLVYGLTGTTNLYEINSVLSQQSVNPYILSFSALLIFAGIGYKISAAPFHFWTPDVYEGAPLPVTAYLSVASKAAGFALLIRLIRISFTTEGGENGTWAMLDNFDWQTLLIIISIGTMTIGNLSALWQNNLKRMLAYSSIAHAGYMLLGVVVLSDQGIIAVMVYFMVYLLMNLGAFYIIMVIAKRTGTEDLYDYDGMGYSAPFLGVALTIFLVSLTGLPPTAGFIGKLYLFSALVDAQMFTVAFIALLNTVVSLYYYIRVLKHMFLSGVKENAPAIDVSSLEKGFVIILLIPVLVLGVYFTPILNIAKSLSAIFLP